METNIKTNPQLPIIGKELLKKLDSKQITMADFNKECAYWMMGDVSTMYYKHCSVRKPDVLQNYEDERNRNHDYQVAHSFWQRDDVTEYTMQDRLVRNGNKANWYWLNFMKIWIDPKDLINQGKIASAMVSYKNDGYVVKDDWRNR